ncbi:MAG: hypothetical protein PWP34_1564 [Desulfuromonadales bacterium]|jgi:hypothetical protein|nr:hypothetical protein [Desulfuromonadales bacterium]
MVIANGQVRTYDAHYQVKEPPAEVGEIYMTSAKFHLPCLWAAGNGGHFFLA